MGAQLDDLQRDSAPYRDLLVCDPDGAEATLADLFAQFVGPDFLPALLGFQPRQLRLDLRRTGSGAGTSFVAS